MSRIALFSAVLILSFSGTAMAGGLFSADEGAGSFLDQPTVDYNYDHGYQRVNWFAGYEPTYGSCSANAWDGYCPKKCHWKGPRAGGGCKSCNR